MAINFTNATNASQGNGVKMLVYSRSGMGKTIMCATAPSPVLISVESGSLSLYQKNLERVYGVGHPHVTYNIPIIEISTLDELNEAYQWCSNAAEAQAFHTVCMDSISDIAEKVLSNAMARVKDPRQAYGELLTQMESVIRLFRDLQGKHVYMTAKQGTIKDDLTGVGSYGPSMPGSKLGEKLPYFFDEMFALRMSKDAEGKEYRYLQTQPDLQYEAKDRSGSLDTVEAPFLSSIINKILGD